MQFLAGTVDVAVIGAGHAGIEAALASARLGLKTIVFSINLDAVGNMPCNPAIGGIWCVKLMRWAAKWDVQRMRRVFSIVCSTAARALPCTRCVHRQTVRNTESI